jgi:DNA-binding NtrC family response regulator
MEMVARGGISSDAVASHPNLFPNGNLQVFAPVADDTGKKSEVIAPVANPVSMADRLEEEEPDFEKILDISHETEEESLLLEQQEKEMILKALKKNHNRRKNAARDLGISERTLYRKIKLFGIDE